MATRTANFGVGKRESHDASGFYERFVGPELSDDETIDHGDPSFNPGPIHGDSRRMDAVADNSVALVVTSPPYFAGKAYEEILGADGVPESYVEYLELLRDVFAECKRKLEPGGRMAINVANLGRKPYRSLSADVMNILQNDLKMLIRGEVIWRKAEGAGGNCAWGSFRSANNPVLRDVTERVIVASKGRFDRAQSVAKRRAEGLPSESTLSNDEFMQATLDVWDMAPESAHRVNHPAPFPVELPERLIRLYTFQNDLVLDPFVGSGTTLVAADAIGRRAIGYDLDESYVQIAKERLHQRLDVTDPPVEDRQALAAREGKGAPAIAEALLIDAGFELIQKNARVRGLGLGTNLVMRDQTGQAWYFDISGAFTTTRNGLARSSTLWSTLGRVNVVISNDSEYRVVLLTSHLPKVGSENDSALRAVGRKAIFDAMEMFSDEAKKRLAQYAQGSAHPLLGYWTEKDLALTTS